MCRYTKALLVGINYYDPVAPELTRLRGCLNDVASQVNLLVAKYGQGRRPFHSSTPHPNDRLFAANGSKDERRKDDFRR